MTTTAHLTLHHFLRIPEQEPALEFDADGTIHEKMSPNTDHAALQAHLARLLLNWIDVHPRRRGGYVYTELRTNVGGASKLPDVAFYRHRPRESARKHALEVADLAVEILSPRDDLEERRAKCQWVRHRSGADRTGSPRRSTPRVSSQADRVVVLTPAVAQSHARDDDLRQLAAQINRVSARSM